jgi:hypothetical protein
MADEAPVEILIKCIDLDLISGALEKFSDTRVEFSGMIRAGFPTVMHSLAFDEATASVPWSSANRPPLDQDGWELWDDAAPGQREIGAPLLPAAFDDRAQRIFRYEYTWIIDPQSEPNLRLANQLGLQRIPGGQPLWRAVKILWRNRDNIWKVARSWQVALGVTAGKLAWKEVQRQAANERPHLDYLEAQRIASLALSEERRQRLNSGSARQREKWRQHYSVIDQLVEINSR